MEENDEKGGEQERLEALEDRLEERWAVRAIERCRAEGGEPIPAEVVFEKLGL